MSKKESRRFKRINSHASCSHHILGSSEKTDSESDGAGKVLLIGNPNVGKSVIFGHLTGTYVTVSNYPGTTVELTTGKATFNGNTTYVVDTPGVNSLIPMSEDEVVTRDILLKERPKAVIHVADAKNLRRSLFLTLQLIEMGVPMILDLNMSDEARARGISIDVAKLSRRLGIPVVETVAIRGKGIDDLTALIDEPASPSDQMIRYSPEIEAATAEIAALLPDAPISKRALALMFLARDQSLLRWAQKHLDPEVITQIEKIAAKAEQKLGQRLRYLITRERMAATQTVLENLLEERKSAGNRWVQRLNHIMLHPVWGFAFVLFVLFLLYEFVGVFGAGTLVDFLEGVVFAKWIVAPLTAFLNRFVPFSFLKDFLVGDYGMISMALSYSVAIVFPIVATFFIAFSVLEDSGYLPRLAVIVNRLFRTMGLNGKAVLPMVLGLGCDTMATLTTRILDSKKERIIVTLLLALGVPCSAQLGVILGILGGLSPVALVVWLGVVLLVLFAVGFLSSKVVPGRTSDFIVELSPLRIPDFWNILAKTTARIEWYLKEAVPLFFLGTLLLFGLDKLNLLVKIQNLAAPVVQRFLQLPPKATEAFLIGFLRRDYGVAGLFSLAQNGQLDTVQIIVSLVTITLFVPCIANFFIIIKEHGWKTALAIVGFIFPFAFLVGGVLNFILRGLGLGG